MRSVADISDRAPNSPGDYGDPVNSTETRGAGAELPVSTTSATPTSALRQSRPRRRNRVVAAVSILLVGCAGTVWIFSWWAPPTYAPTASVTLRGAPLDSLGHDTRVRTLGTAPYVLEIEPIHSPGPSGALLYFGALHSKDPDHPQQATLRRVWQEFRPTVALVEGRMGFFVGTARQGVGVFGEGATVYALAKRAGIPLFTLEPPLEREIAALDECGDRTQIAMFRVLSGYMSARRGGAVTDFKIGRLLTQRAAPLTDTLPDIAAFDAYYVSQFPDQPNWRDMPEEALWPGKSDTLLHRMATRSNRLRDEHFNQTTLDLVSHGERVFAIAGRSHSVIQEPILWESLQPAKRGPLSSSRQWEVAGP